MWAFNGLKIQTDNTARSLTPHKIGAILKEELFGENKFWTVFKCVYSKQLDSN